VEPAVGRCSSGRAMASCGQKRKHGAAEAAAIPDTAAGDLTIEFDGAEPLLVHSPVLTLASSAFRSMLTQDMMEKSRRTIHLHGKDPEEFKMLLSFLTPGSGRIQKISETNVDILLRWADEYCIDSLRGECVAFVESQPPTVHRVLQAHAFGMEAYLDRCIGELLRSGCRDWGECVADPDLLKRIFATSLKVNDALKADLQKTKAAWLPPDHVHKAGSLSKSQKLECAKCMKSYSSISSCCWQWQCTNCRYK